MRPIPAASTRAALVVVLALALSLPAVADPGAVAPGTTAEVVNGVLSQGHPTTAALLYSDGGPISLANAEVGCSATLIGCQTVLTAAHCVEGEPAGRILVFLQHAGLFAVSKVTVHPSYASQDADVAVLKLAAKVTGITPSKVNRTVDPANRTGSRGVIAGYGNTGGDKSDYGIKRAGEVVTAGCASSSGGELDDRTYVCWRYDASVGAPGQDSNTCNGDSGGPLFLDFGGGPVVAGVTSGGLVFDCGPGDVSYDANVYTYRSFVQTQLGSDSTAACGGLPAVGKAATRVVGKSGSLAKGQEVRTTFTVGAGARELRFALNGRDDGRFDVDLYVKRGGSVSTSSYDCRQKGASPFGACRFASPAKGTWTAMVRAQAGSGTYQLIATSFGATLAADGGTTSGGGGGGGGEDACEEAVCGVDPYCCNVEWDDVCEEEAEEVCG